MIESDIDVGGQKGNAQIIKAWILRLITSLEPQIICIIVVVESIKIRYFKPEQKAQTVTQLLLGYPLQSSFSTILCIAKYSTNNKQGLKLLYQIQPFQVQDPS